MKTMVFIHHLVNNGHLGCSHVLAVANSPAMNTEVHVFELWFSCGLCPIVGMLGHMVGSMLSFKGFLHCLP